MFGLLLPTTIQDETPVSNFMDLFGRKPAVVWHDSKLGETLSMFKAEKSHMAIVRDVVSEGQVHTYCSVVYYIECMYLLYCSVVYYIECMYLLYCSVVYYIECMSIK